MFSHLINAASESDASAKSTADALTMLRRLTLDEFGQILAALPSDRWPNLSNLLPGRTPDDVQKQWTGSCGDTLLRQSISFMNSVSATFTEFTAKSIRGQNVLDFGCGWGRLLRLLSFFNDPKFIYGCDAWQISLNHSKAANIARIVNSLNRSDEAPEELPFPDVEFALVYAFSIFTHLSPTAAGKCMAAIRKSMRPDGIAIISVRPIEFWAFNQKVPEKDREALTSKHAAGEVAFFQQTHDYGDTGIPIEAIPAIFPGWEILRAGATLIDPYQVFVVLRPV